ncbi:MAG TPA: hypothetical protein DIT64_09635 [Verrucomicrobiales bacterium]|nr:hypothetical protein [Verrucomicrobiales bacterium]
MPAKTAFAYLDSRTERPGDEVSADVFRAIAVKIEADPSLLRIPLANIDRWLARGHSAVSRLEQWRAVLLSAMSSNDGLRSLLALLRDSSAEAVFFKEFSPFPGVLSSEELKRFRWTSAH